MIAAGLTLILGVLRVLNFAHGAVYMLGGYVCFSLVGLFSGIHLYQLLFTFALVLIAGDIVRFTWGTQVLSVSLPEGFKGAVNLGAVWYPSYRLFLCAVGVIVAVALWYFVNRTRAGRFVRAAGQDQEMLEALGIDVGRIYLFVFVAGSALAGLGGALASPAVALSLGMDAEIIVQCFIIVIIGGMGSLGGAFLGALILGLLNSFGVMLVPNFEIVLIYLMMVVVLMIRPWGLLGQPEAK